MGSNSGLAEIRHTETFADSKQLFWSVADIRPSSAPELRGRQQICGIFRSWIGVAAEERHYSDPGIVQWVLRRVKGQLMPAFCLERVGQPWGRPGVSGNEGPKAPEGRQAGNGKS
eukprot:647390-Pelagomonas_calceolata.AAC.1